MFPNEAETVFLDNNGNFDDIILDIPNGETYTILNTVVIKDSTTGEVEVNNLLNEVLCHANGSSLVGQCLMNYVTDSDVYIDAQGNANAEVFASITYLPYDSSLLPNQFQFDQHFWGISLTLVMILAILVTQMIQKFYD
jgi:hypothetical protein